jgi:glutathione S-transferase
VAIELYVFPPSPRAFKVLAVANHLDIPYETKLLDLRKGEQKAAEYAALNPNMRMPTLKDGAFVLWESNAILQYLALQRPDSGLLPREERARLDVTRWQFWELAHWDPPCAGFLLERVVKPALVGTSEPDQATLGRAEEQWHRAAKVLDNHLEGRSFVCGDALTLADFSLGAALNLAEAGRFPLAPYAQIRRWHAALCELPAWRRTLAETGSLARPQ